MASPLSMFRKYQKVLLALFGVMLMIAFVVVPSVMTFLHRREPTATSSGSQVALTWARGLVTEDELLNMRYAHNLTVRFLDELLRQTMERDQRANPRGSGITRDHLGRIVDPGIPRDDSEESLVETMVLAAKADETGIVVADDAIHDFLRQLTDDVLGDADFRAILPAATNQRLSEVRLFDELRKELLAQKMRQLACSGLYGGAYPIITPAAAWDYQNRLSRRVKLELAPLRVADFKKDIREPSAAEINALYDKYKDVFPYPDSPEPGFKRRRKIAFQYVKADFDKFLQAEKAKVTDEQTAQYYKQHKSDFRAPELPSAEEAPAAQDKKKTAEQGASARAAPPKPTPPAKKDKKKAGGLDTSAKTAPPKQIAPAKQDKKETGEQGAAGKTPPPRQTPAAKQDASAKTAPPKEITPAERPGPKEDVPQPPAQPREEPPSGGATTGEKDKTSQLAGEEIYVSAGAEGQGRPASGDKRKDSPTPSATVEGRDQPPPAAQRDPADRLAAAGEKPAETTTAKDDARAKKSAEEKSPKGVEPAEKKEPKYKPLAQVQDEIRRSLAQQPAKQQMDAALADVKRRVDAFFEDYVKWEAWDKWKEEGTDIQQVKKPAPIDVGRLATDLNAQYRVDGGLTGRETPLADSIEFTQRHAAGDERFELAGAYHLSFETGQVQQVPFVQIGFQEGALHRANSIDAERDVHYLYWKTAEQKEATPELKDIRAEVADAWKQGEALTKAMAEAQRCTEKARKAGGSLKQALADTPGLSVTESDEFSWMTTGALPYSPGALRLSDVKGVESAGQEFMESVFSLKEGEAGVAMNRPRTFVYVVRPMSYSPPEDQRRRDFAESGLTFAVLQLAHFDQQQTYRRWYQQLETEMEVVWKRAPGNAPSLR